MLVVGVRSTDGSLGDTQVPPMEGSGIIIGATRDSVFVVTARHVLVARGGGFLRHIFVFVYPDSSRAIPASFTFESTDSTNTGGQDLAVIAFARDSSMGFFMPRLNRLGARLPKVGDRVFAMGCPRRGCWVANPDERILPHAEMILYRSFSTVPGMSGSALFDLSGDVVGVVLSVDSYAGRAVPIDLVRSVIEHERPGLVQLVHATYPRRGYGQSVGLSWLSGGTGERTHIPSFRAAAALAIGYSLEGHIAVLRLARPNTVITGALAGVGLPLRRSRVALLLFAEGGFATFEARVDQGGYYIATAPHEVPSWVPVEGTGIGGGAGVSLQLSLPHRAIAEIAAAKWRFVLPATVDFTKGMTLGVGLRLGKPR